MGNLLLKNLSILPKILLALLSHSGGFSNGDGGLFGGDPVGEPDAQAVSYTHLDFLNGHGGDHHAHLAHDDLRSQVADFLPGAAQQARGGVLHDFRQGGDGLLYTSRCV